MECVEMNGARKLRGRVEIDRNDTDIDIVGAKELRGRVEIHGSKNAVLPILAGCILHEGITRIHFCPKIQDVFDTIWLMEMIGCRIWWEGNTLVVDASFISERQIPMSITSRMRSSVLFLGALLGRCHCAGVCYPGGCVLGDRPVNLHIDALRKMGADIREEGGCIFASAAHLGGNEITIDFPSVGATENIILAATLAEGVTVIRHAAREPEIGELCRFLKEKGADIDIDEIGTIEIHGGKPLNDSDHYLAPDRIAAGTYMIAGAVTDSLIEIGRVPVEQMREVLSVLEQIGIGIRCEGDTVWIDGRGPKTAVDLIETAPYPGFPTDLQSPMMTLLSVSKGESRIRETIFQDRFKTAAQLSAMGAQIWVEGCEARIRGVERLHGAEVTARELRGSAALLLAGLNAQGRTKLCQCQYIHRGYENIFGRLRALGAEIYSREQ